MFTDIYREIATAYSAAAAKAPGLKARFEILSQVPVRPGLTAL